MDHPRGRLGTDRLEHVDRSLHVGGDVALGGDVGVGDPDQRGEMEDDLDSLDRAADAERVLDVTGDDLDLTADVRGELIEVGPVRAGVVVDERAHLGAVCDQELDRWLPMNPPAPVTSTCFPLQSLIRRSSSSPSASASVAEKWVA